MHVAHVFGAMDIGGAELRTLEVMDHLGDQVRATYITLSGRRGTLAERIEESGGTVRPMPLDARFGPHFWSFLRSESVDVVHSHVATFSGATLGVARAAGVPRRIAHFRSDGDAHGDGTRRKIQRRVMRSLIRRHATDIVGVAPSALTRGFDADWELDPRCQVIPNGLALVDASTMDPSLLRAETGIPGNVPILVHVGRPSPEKNRERLPAILRAVHQAGQAAHLVVIGPHDPAWDRRLIEAANRAEVADWVMLAGPRPEVQRYVVGADVLLLPSHREGLPGAVLEARACGIPVVASDLDGVRFAQAELGGVATVPLSASDQVWSESILSALRAGRIPLGEAHSDFRASRFNLDVAADAFRGLYGLPVTRVPT